MFIIYLALFGLGLFLFGWSFNVPGWEAVIFSLGILSISAAMFLMFHGPGRAESEIQQ